MDPRGQFAAQILDAGAWAIAAGVATRQAELYPDELGGATFSDLRAEAEARVAHLAESAATGTTELFAAHVTWLRDAYVARGVSLDLLQGGLRCLRDEVVEALQEDVHEPLLAQIDAGLAALREPADPLESLLGDGTPHVELARGFLLAMLEGRRSDALVLVESAVADGAPVDELLRDVIVRVQREVGRMWQRGEVRVAEEHIGSTIVVEALAALRHHIPAPATTEKRALVAAVKGNAHSLGPRIVCDHLQLAGWHTIFLGEELPVEEVVWSVGEYRPDVVALSTALPTQVRATAAVVEALRAAYPELPLLVGGGAYRAAPELWRAVGADACALDGAGAVAEAERLLTRRDSTPST